MLAKMIGKNEILESIVYVISQLIFVLGLGKRQNIAKSLPKSLCKFFCQNFVNSKFHQNFNFLVQSIFFCIIFFSACTEAAQKGRRSQAQE